jgi:hypothetical protein
LQAFHPDALRPGLLALPVFLGLLAGRQSGCPASERPLRLDEDADKSVVQGRFPEQFWPVARQVLADGVRPLPAQPADRGAVPEPKAVAQAGSPDLGEMTALAAAAAVASSPVAWEPQAPPRPSGEAASRRPELDAAAALREPRVVQAAQGVPANVAESSEYRVGRLALPDRQALAAGRSAARAAAAQPVLLPAAPQVGQSAQAQLLSPQRLA